MGIDLGRFRSNKNEEQWVEWLTDDPVPDGIRKKMQTRQSADYSQRPMTAIRRPGERPRFVPREPAQQRPHVAKKDDNRVVSIHIGLPDVRGAAEKFRAVSIKILQSKYGQRIKALPRKYLYAGSGALMIIVIAGVSFAFINGKQDVSGPDKDAKVLSEQSQTPEFAYSLPKGETSGLTSDVKYDAGRKVVNYQDEIGGVAITISQQPLPEDFKTDTEAKVKGLAEGFAATKTIATASPTSYLGTSEKGPQTVIFFKNDLLVFIQSTKQIDEIDWAEYITTLK